MSSRVVLAVVIMVTLGCLCTYASADTIGYWRFEGADDTTGFLSDSSGKGHVLSRSLTPGVFQVMLPSTGAAGSAFPDPILQTWAPNSNAGSFTTANGFLAAAYDTDFLADTFTIEAFISPDELAGNNIVVGQFSSSLRWFIGPSTRQLRIGLGPATSSNVVKNTSLANWEPVGGGNKVSAELAVGKDFYVGASVTLATVGADDGEVTFYMQNLTDGGPLLTQAVTHNVSSLGVGEIPLAIGAIANSAAGGNHFPGLIDEVRFSSGVLSPDQLLVVPEPGSWLLLLSMGLAVLVIRRGRR